LKSIGIDIGPTAIKIAEMEITGKSLRLIQTHNYPLTSKTQSDRDLEVITTLKDALRLLKITEKTKVVMSLPQNKASLRRLSFPFKEKYKILKSLPFEMEDLTPFSVEDSLCEAKVLKRLGIMTEVLAVSIPKETIQNTLERSKDLGLDPDILSLEGLALNNLFEDLFEGPKVEAPNPNAQDFIEDEEGETSPKKNKIIEPKSFTKGEAVLYIGVNSSLLIVRADKQLQYLRQINWGSHLIVQDVAKSFNVQPKEAENFLNSSKGVLLRSEGVEPRDVKVSEIISNCLERLSRSLNLTLLEVKGQHNVSVSGLGLIGGFSALKNVGARLTQHIDMPCNRILKLKNHPEISIHTKAETDCAIAIGLAMEAAKRPTQPAVNFRRHEFSKENSHLKKIWKTWDFHIKLASVSLVLFFVYAQMRSTMSEDLALSARRSMKNTAEKVLKIKKSVATERKLNTLLKDLEKREQIKLKITKYNKDSSSPLKILKTISEKAPSRRQLPMGIKSLSVDSSKVSLTGRTNRPSEIKRFSKSLESIAKGPISTTSKKISIDDKKFTEFSISFTPKKGVM